MVPSLEEDIHLIWLSVLPFPVVVAYLFPQQLRMIFDLVTAQIHSRLSGYAVHDRLQQHSDAHEAFISNNRLVTECQEADERCRLDETDAAQQAKYVRPVDVELLALRWHYVLVRYLSTDTMVVECLRSKC